MCLAQCRGDDCLPAKASYSQVHNPKLIVFFSTHDGLQDKLPATFRDDNYKISSVGMAVGQLGLPHHGRSWAVVVRAAACADPVRIVSGLRVDSCVALSALLGAVSAPLHEGWSELERSSTRNGKQRAEAGGREEKMNDLKECGLLPEDATG